MQAFTDFILTVTLPPNPIRALDNSATTDQSTGQTLFLNRQTDGGAITCTFCHRLPLGTDGLSTFEGETQEFKIAHLRNLYQKIGKFGVPGQGSLGDQVRGFGVLHDGSISTVFDFVSSPVFQNLNTTEKRQLEQFLLAFDTGLEPAVGQQVSIDATTFNATAFVNRINLLVAQANAGACDLVVKGNIAGEERGAVYVGNNNFQTDRHSDALLTTTQVRNLAGTAGQEITFTCVPPGSGTRIGIDRDLDGVFDRRELDCNTDPADPQSFPPTLTGSCGVGTTTTTTTTTTTVAATTSTTHAGTTTTSVAGSTSTTTTTLPSTAFVLVETTALTMRDRTTPPTPSARKMSFKATTKRDATPNRVVAPAPGSAGDPTTGGSSGGGATLIVYDSAGSGEQVTVQLPASGWRMLGKAGAPKGWEFSGSDPSRPGVAGDREGRSAEGEGGEGELGLHPERAVAGAHRRTPAARDERDVVHRRAGEVEREPAVDRVERPRRQVHGAAEDTAAVELSDAALTCARAGAPATVRSPQRRPRAVRCPIRAATDAGRSTTTSAWPGRSSARAPRSVSSRSSPARSDGRVEPEDATDVDERQRPVAVLAREPACRVGDEPRPLRTDARRVLAKERDRVQQHGEHQTILGVLGRREAQEGFGCVAGQGLLSCRRPSKSRSQYRVDGTRAPAFVQKSIYDQWASGATTVGQARRAAAPARAADSPSPPCSSSPGRRGSPGRAPSRRGTARPGQDGAPECP